MLGASLVRQVRTIQPSLDPTTLSSGEDITNGRCFFFTQEIVGYSENYSAGPSYSAVGSQTDLLPFLFLSYCRKRPSLLTTAQAGPFKESDKKLPAP